MTNIISLKSILIIIFIAYSISIKAQDKTVCERIATESINWLQNGEEIKLHNVFTDAVATKLDTETIKKIWSQLESQYGKFNKIDSFASARLKDNLLVDCILNFEKGKLKYRLTFDKNNKIAGIFFSPYSSSKKTGHKAEESTIFTEKKISFTNDGIKFPAMLCLPKQSIKAIVVFIHGSGPNDMDETIGPNKIFKQIAHELAKYGIGSLRYDKRTYLAQQGKIKVNFPLDLQHIIVYDAIAAVNYIAKIDSIKNLPIFIIGHSLGAFAAPLIAKQDTNVAGIILMAANSRPLEDIVVQQYKYIYARGGYSKAEKKEIKKMKQQAKNVKSLKKDLSKNKIKKLILVSDTNFWLSLNAYKPVETANKLQIPILNIHGSRDYQIPQKDFTNWIEKTNKEYKVYSRMLNTTNEKPINFSKKAVVFISYNSLNHLFMYGEGKSYPEEYNRQGNVSKLMISDMANWINLYSNK